MIYELRDLLPGDIYRQAFDQRSNSCEDIFFVISIKKHNDYNMFLYEVNLTQVEFCRWIDFSDRKVELLSRA